MKTVENVFTRFIFQLQYGDKRRNKKLSFPEN